MKKRIISLLASLACIAVCAGCIKENPSDSSPTTSTPPTSSTPAPEESSTPETSSPPETSSTPDSSSDDSTEQEPYVEALEKAKEFIYGTLINKDVEVKTDYTLLSSYYSGFLDEMLTVTWTVDVTEGVTIKEGTDKEGNACWVVDVDEFLKEDLFYKLTGTISDSEGHSVSFTLDRKVLKAAQVVPEKITEAPVEGTAYKLYMYQVKKNAELYFIGDMSGFYLATTESDDAEAYLKAVDVYVENVEGKEGYFYMYFNDANGVKQYFAISNSHNSKGWHVNIIYTPTQTLGGDVEGDGKICTYEFTYSAEYGTVIATAELTYENADDQIVTGTTSFYLGTYQTYMTIGTSNVENYKNSDASLAYLVTMVDKSQVSAEDKVASEKKTLSVTTAYNGEVKAELPVQGKTYGDVAISWAVKSGDATVTDNVLTVAAPAEETTIVLTATFKCGDVTDTRDVEITVYPKSPVTAVTEPKEGEAYAMYMYHTAQAKNYYFTGAMSGDYLATTDDALKAADVYIENAEGGFKIYVLNDDGSKSYITLSEYQKEGKTYYSASISMDEVGSVFTFNTQFGTLCCKTENDTFFLGTYGSYTTISASGVFYMTADKLGTEQFYATFGLIDESAVTTPVEPETPTYSTPEEILNALYALADGEALEGEFTLTGTITELDSYNNPTIVVKGFDDMPVYCYKLKVENAVGDVITVTATSMKNYGGTYEFMNCTLVESEGGEGETPVDPEAGLPEDGATLTIKEILALEVTADTTRKYYVTGTVTEVYDTTWGNMYITDGNGNTLTVYGTYDADGNKYDAMTDKPIAGATVKLYSILSVWNGKNQLKNATIVEFTNPEGGETVEPETPTYSTPEEILKALYALADGEALEGEFTLTGTITELDSYNNPTIVVKGFDDMPVYCYKLKVENAVGDVITVTATSMKNYGGTYEFMNCTLVESEGGEGETPVEPPVEDTDSILKEATAYKFYVAQANLGLTYYVTGATSGNYLATTLDPSEAIDVYAEKTEAGYSFYFTVEDTKTYININESGKVALATETPTVYNYNEETKIWWTTVGSTDYYLGTYNNYTTVGSSKTSFISVENTGVTQFPATFVLATEAKAPTAEEKIAYEKAMLNVNTNITGAATIELATETTYSDVTITWALTESAIATLDKNVLTISNPEAETKVALTATLAVDEVSEVVTFEIAVEPKAEGEVTSTVFEFGDNGDAVHKDGTDIGTGKSYTSGNYTLELTSASKVYDGAYDAAGNSCLKLGTSSTVGTFTFTVADDVTEVVIKVAKYKAKTTKIDVNGTQYTIETSSNDGAYTEIKIDTTTTKTIVFATLSGSARAMINSITFVS